MSKPVNRPLAKPRPAPLRRGGVSTATLDNVANKVKAAESAQTNEFEIKQIPISKIRLWEEQPRSFCLTLDDIYRGTIDPNDSVANKKIVELEGIIGLALSVRELGILNTPLAYALPGKDVQLLGGQRRTMAVIFSLLHITDAQEEEGDKHVVVVNESPDLSILEQEKITVKVFLRKPDALAVERIGMADNTQRTDLPLGDKLRWVVRFADMKEGLGHTVTRQDLVDTLGLNRSQAYQWLKVVQSRDDEIVKKCIDAVVTDKLPLARLTEIAAAPQKERAAIFESWHVRPTSDTSQKVSLGTSSNMGAIKSLVLANVPQKDAAFFENTDWSKAKEVKKAFTEFLKIWEAAHG